MEHSHLKEILPPPTKITLLKHGGEKNTAIEALLNPVYLVGYVREG